MEVGINFDKADGVMSFSLYSATMAAGVGAKIYKNLEQASKNITTPPCGKQLSHRS